MADSLLAALEELNEQELRASDYASDAVLVIDNDLRTIAVPSNFIFGVYNDKNVLSVNFEMPRTYDDVDLSDFTIQINYLAPNKVGNVYEVTDSVIGEDKITFEWLLDRGVFLSSGTVEFTVCLREIGQEGAIIREFNTTIAKGTVLAGLEIEDPEDPEAYSLIAHIKQMDERVTYQAATVASDYAKTARIADDVEAIAEELADDVAEVKEKYGTPLVAATAAGMTDHTKIYVYTGSETGYTFGNWYYYDGAAWTSGGVYNSAGINTDATLSVSGMPADAKKTGDEISGLKEDLEQIGSVLYSKGDQIQFPTDYNGKVIVDSIRGKLLTGGHNLISYIDFIDGEYSLNGITIKVQKNKLTINGTSAAAVYFAPHIGEITTNATGFMGETSYNLPIMEYGFGANWNNVPQGVTIGVRSRTSGNVVNVARSDVYKDVTYNHETWGEIYLYIPSGRTAQNTTIEIGLVPKTVDNVQNFFSEYNNILTISSIGVFELSSYSVLDGTTLAYDVEIKADDFAVSRYIKTCPQFIKGAKPIEYLYCTATTGSPGRINFTQDANRLYNSYYYVFPAGSSLYFENGMEGCTYLSLCIGENPGELTPNAGELQASIKYYIPCSNAIRIRKTTSEDTLPHGEANAIDVGGKLVCFTADINSQDFGFWVRGLSYDQYLPISLSKLGDSRSYPVTQKAVKTMLSVNQKLCYLQYENASGSEKLYIWIPIHARKYVKYVFEHTILASKNANVWRVDRAYLCYRDLAEEMLLTEGGEWECAVRLAERDDFSGGKAHGDEIFNNITFVIDGVAVSDISVYTNMTEFARLNILQNSTLYDPADSTTVIAVHMSEHVFADDEKQLKIKQTVKWEGSFDIATCYLAMFPISKSVSDEWYNDYSFNKESIVLGSYYNINEVNLFSSVGNIQSQFGVSKYVKNDNYSKNGRFMISDNGGLSYNKCYYTIAAGESITAKSGEVTSDTVWQTETYYDIKQTLS